MSTVNTSERQSLYAEVTSRIIAELEAEQQLINANKKLIEIYQQKIKSKIAEVWGE